VLHPILKYRKNLIVYIIVWTVITVLNFFIQLHFYNFDISTSLSECLVFNILFSLLGIGIWYPVYYTDLEKNRIFNLLINHFVSGLLAVVLWIGAGYIILTSIFITSQEYIHYFITSIPWRVGFGFLLYMLFASIYYLMIYYQNFRDKMIGESELRALVKESELNSLKAQINPHFLFNSLNSISSLTMISPGKAQEMVITLSEFLRYSLSQKNESLTTFEKELKNIDRYLGIELIRFGKKLFVKKEIDTSCLRFLLPGLILQPIIENAVKYGVYESINQSNIIIAAHCTNDMLIVSVKNDYDPESISKKGEGIGIRNVSSRLKIQYNRDDLIKMSKDENIFEITMRFPQTF
jgi:two-component system, LytTR family, sensor kinase